MHVEIDVKVISRSGGRSATGAAAYRSGTSVVAKAAYRSGDKLQDEKYDKTHDYTRKENVMWAGILTPDHAPRWMQDREKLWNAVEAREDRSTRPQKAQLAREALLILPRGLTKEQYQRLVKGYAQEAFVKRGMVADIAIHAPEASDGGKNYHAHVLLTTREVKEGMFGNKVRDWNGDLKTKGGKRFQGNTGVLDEWRALYQEHVNRAMEDAGSEYRADLRSNKDKGIDREPQPKRGIGQRIEQRGGPSYSEDQHRRIQRRNAMMAYYESQRAQPWARDGDWMHNQGWLGVEQATASHSEAREEAGQRRDEIRARLEKEHADKMQRREGGMTLEEWQRLQAVRVNRQKQQQHGQQMKQKQAHQAKQRQIQRRP